MIAKRLTRDLAVVAAICAIAARLGAQRVERTPVPASVSGPLSVIWEDNFKTGATRARTMVFDRATRRTYEISLDSATVKRFGGARNLRGRSVELNAAPDGRATNVRSTAQAIPKWVPGTPTWTTSRVLVVLCRPSDGDTPFGSADDFKDLWFGSGPLSVRTFWRESSNGLLDVTGQVLDWFIMPGKSADYKKADGSLDLEKYIPACEAGIPQSVDLTQFDVIAHELGNGLPVELGGLADTLTVRGVKKTFGSTITGWKPHPQNDMGPHAHELGHALGLFHSGPLDGDTYSSNWDIMSNATAWADATGNILYGSETSQAQKDLLGFIPLSRRFVATGASNTITLERGSLPGNNANYLMALVPISFPDSTGQRYYTVELRQRAGFDSKLVTEGVVVHRSCCDEGDMQFTVQDRDGNYDVNDRGAALQAGDTWEDRARHISVTVESMDASSARVTIRNGAGRQFALGATGGKKTLVEGSAQTDSIAITVSASSALPWTARTARTAGAGIGLLTSSGAGSGWIRFRRGATTLAPGTYYDTLTVTLPSDHLDRVYYDTLVVTPGSALHLGLSMATRRDSNFVGRGVLDSALVRISGSNAATATWTARRKKPWGFQVGLTQPVTVTGTGNGVIRFSTISAQNTPTGWYIDTITVKLDATPDSAVIIDSLLVLPTLQYSLSTRGRRDTIQAGADSKLDSVSIAFSGLWSTRAAWKVSNGNRPFRFLVPIENDRFAGSYLGTGDGTAYFKWVTADSTKSIALQPGTYVDTLFAAGPFPAGIPNFAQAQQLIIDTLVVLPNTRPAGLTLSAAARVDTIALGINQSIDSVIVTPGGARPDTVQWAADVFLTAHGQIIGPDPNGPPSPVTVFLSQNTSFGYGGKGRGWLRYQRNVAGKTPGTYVGTISITTLDKRFNVVLRDTVVILPGTALSLNRGGRADTAAAGAKTPVADSASLTVLGANASTTAWTATKRRAFTTITTPSGTGPALLRWTHDVSALTAGVYFDTITVSAGANARGTMFIDTLIVKGASGSTQIAVAKFDTDSIAGVLNYQFSSTLSINAAPLNQSLLSYATLVDWDSTVVQLDSARAAGGFPQPTVTQTNKAHISLNATAPTGQSGVVPLAQLYFHFSASNVGKQTSITPTFTSAKSPTGADLVAFLIQSSAKAVVVPGALRGDVNADGRLTSADALILLRGVVGIQPPAGSQLTPNGDANCNGKNEAIDVQYILAKLVGLNVGTACVGQIK